MPNYSNIVWDHFLNPCNIGQIEKADVIAREGDSIFAGHFIEFSARIRKGIIEEIKFVTFGCAPAVASGSILCQALSSKSILEIEEWNTERLIKELGGLPDEKHYIAETAIKALKLLYQRASALSKP
jgi:NifU-like protein involved in Fe-S cluster formation